MERIFVDTGGWYALVDRNDPNHLAAVRFMTENTRPLVTTSYVLDEILTLVKSRLGYKQAAHVGDSIRVSRFCTLSHVTSDDENEAWITFKQYDDKAWSFTDCTSLVIMQRLGIATAFAFDEHFAQMGFTCAP
jgi:hypothetical protein